MYKHSRRDDDPSNSCPSGYGLEYYNCATENGGFRGCCSTNPCSDQGCPDVRSAISGTLISHSMAFQLISRSSFADDTLVSSSIKSRTSTSSTSARETSRPVNGTPISSSGGMTATFPEAYTSTSTSVSSTAVNASLSLPPSAPTPSPAPAPTTSLQSEPSRHKEIIGPLVGGIITGLLLLALFIWILWKRRKSNLHEITSPTAARRFNRLGIFNRKSVRTMTPMFRTRRSSPSYSNEKHLAVQPPVLQPPPRRPTPPPPQVPYHESDANSEETAWEIKRATIGSCPSTPPRVIHFESIPSRRPASAFVVPSKSPLTDIFEMPDTSSEYGYWRDSTTVTEIQNRNSPVSPLSTRVSQASNFVLPSTAYCPPSRDRPLNEQRNKRMAAANSTHILSWMDFDGSKVESPLTFRLTSG